MFLFSSPSGWISGSLRFWACGGVFCSSGSDIYVKFLFVFIAYLYFGLVFFFLFSFFLSFFLPLPNECQDDTMKLGYINGYLIYRIDRTYPFDEYYGYLLITECIQGYY